MAKKTQQPRCMIALPMDLHARLKREQVKVRKQLGMDVSLSSLIRKAIEQTFGKEV
jgi:hypothetical protein